MTRTIVFFHAHPDDEVLLTGGTMARLTAEGHRVVLVTATTGGAGLASSAVTVTESLAAVRLGELARSAQLLGCARLEVLGYADSGMHGDLNPESSFSRASPEAAARRLAGVLIDEAADALTVYDSAGGYGHPDHRQVHAVGVRAAELAATALVLEATIDRRVLGRALRLARWTLPNTTQLSAATIRTWYADPARITHRVDVRRYLSQKRQAMAAHTSQTTADDTSRVLTWMLRLPPALFRIAFGREWFIEHLRAPARPPLDDLLATLRTGC
jgi:LmbE family N-acetylglucosaminyl deacetylase